MVPAGMLCFLVAVALGFAPEARASFGSGRLAQLGERRVRNAEVASSILAPSTTKNRLPIFHSAQILPIEDGGIGRRAPAPASGTNSSSRPPGR